MIFVKQNSKIFIYFLILWESDKVIRKNDHISLEQNISYYTASIFYTEQWNELSNSIL